MTRKKLEIEKKKLHRVKPTMDTADYQRYQQEMAEWDAKLEALLEEECRLEEKEIKERLEDLGLIANLEKRRNNRLITIDTLKGKFRAIGLDRRYGKKKVKSLQWDICLQIADLEAEVAVFGADIEALVAKHINSM